MHVYKMLQVSSRSHSVTSQTADTINVSVNGVHVIFAQWTAQSAEVT